MFDVCFQFRFVVVVEVIGGVDLLFFGIEQIDVGNIDFVFGDIFDVFVDDLLICIDVGDDVIDIGYVGLCQELCNGGRRLGGIGIIFVLIDVEEVVIVV